MCKFIECIAQVALTVILQKMYLMDFPDNSSAVIQPVFYANTHLFY